MKIEHFDPDLLKQMLRALFGKHLDLTKYKVFFFGSRIKGNNMERSDIDIGIDGPKEISPSIKFQIEEELEKIPTLYKLELVDFQKVSPSFRKEALRSIEMLN